MESTVSMASNHIDMIGNARDPDVAGHVDP